MLITSPMAAERVAQAVSWLASRGAATPVVVVAATGESASDVIRQASRVTSAGASFGWQRFTLGRLAAQLAARRLAEAQLATVGMLALEALCARVVHQLAQRGALGR